MAGALGRTEERGVGLVLREERRGKLRADLVGRRDRCRGRSRRARARAARRAFPWRRWWCRRRRPARPSSRHARRRSPGPRRRRTAPARSRPPARPARRPAGRSPARRPWARRARSSARRPTVSTSVEWIWCTVRRSVSPQRELGGGAAAVLAHIVGLIARAVAAVERGVEAFAHAALAREEAMLHAVEVGKGARLDHVLSEGYPKSRPARRFCRRPRPKRGRGCPFGRARSSEPTPHRSPRAGPRWRGLSGRRRARRCPAAAGSRPGPTGPKVGRPVARASAAKSTWALRSVSPGRSRMSAPRWPRTACSEAPSAPSWP